MGFAEGSTIGIFFGFCDIFGGGIGVFFGFCDIDGGGTGAFDTWTVVDFGTLTADFWNNFLFIGFSPTIALTAVGCAYDGGAVMGTADFNVGGGMGVLLTAPTTPSTRCFFAVFSVAGAPITFRFAGVAIAVCRAIEAAIRAARSRGRAETGFERGLLGSVTWIVPRMSDKDEGDFAMTPTAD